MISMSQCVQSLLTTENVIMSVKVDKVSSAEVRRSKPGDPALTERQQAVVAQFDLMKSLTYHKLPSGVLVSRTTPSLTEVLKRAIEFVYGVASFLRSEYSVVSDTWREGQMAAIRKAGGEALWDSQLAEHQKLTDLLYRQETYNPVSTEPVNNRAVQGLAELAGTSPYVVRFIESGRMESLMADLSDMVANSEELYKKNESAERLMARNLGVESGTDEVRQGLARVMVTMVFHRNMRPFIEHELSAINDPVQRAEKRMEIALNLSAGLHPCLDQVSAVMAMRPDQRAAAFMANDSWMMPPTPDSTKVRKGEDEDTGYERSSLKQP